MNYKEISADEHEKLLQNKKNIFKNTFKNTNVLVENRKKFLETDPDTIIKKQQKDDYIEKLSDLISQKFNNTDELKKISNKIDSKKNTYIINLKKVADKIDLKNDETSQPSCKTDYIYYIKNPNILADKIVEIYEANPNAKVYNPRNKENNVKLQNVVNKINEDENIGKQCKEFVNEFRNIHKNTYIEYDYQTYKNLVLDRINNQDGNNDGIIKEIGKEFGKKLLKNVTGQGIDEYKNIKIDKDALKKNILKIRYNNGRKLNNKYLHDDMIISNNMKNAVMKNTNLGTLYTLDLFMRIKNSATRKAVKTIILTFRLASSNHYQLGCDDQLIS